MARPRAFARGHAHAVRHQLHQYREQQGRNRTGHSDRSTWTMWDQRYFVRGENIGALTARDFTLL